ncbi:MAG TPA: class I SAM-dependent methyltransferase, partial [Trebonia sp.]|nr:class I SAM-dependent methyltransferase [Trebonia sp.]
MNENPAVLLSPLGREALARAAALLGDARGSELAVAAALRREYPASLAAAAVAQHELRLAAREKFSRAMEMLFTRAGYEQSSSETVARHRAARFGGARRVADLCCGIGGDLIALAAAPRSAAPESPEPESPDTVLAVDRDEIHARLAVHNAGVYGEAGRVRACVADVRDIALGGVDAVFIDPARRAGTRRFPAGVSQPPLDWCLALAGQVPAVCVKAAPGLPAELIPPGWEAEFIADGRDLKEAVLWSPAFATAQRRATILPAGDTLTRALTRAPAAPDEPGTGAGIGADPVEVSEPGAYLLDPSPAVTRAGLVEDLARLLGARKIDPRIAFLTADREVATPFARTLRVVESAPWNEKRFAARLRELGVGAADIRRRGLAGDVDQIRRRLKLSGPHRATVVLTRVNDKPWGL